MTDEQSTHDPGKDSEPEPPLQPGHRLGPYEIKRLLGSGAFADVYLARHRLLEQDFALKLIRTPEAERWEEQGAKIMCRLRHPHVVSVHFADRIDNRLVIAMDYVEGRTLRELLRERGRMETAEALRIAASVAEALEYVHHLEADGASNIAHLDLKPSNILVDKGGTVRITDFGIAQVAGAAASRAGAAGGSPAYMAPEQFAGKSSPQSDLWAVGVLLYEMLLGRTPHRGQSVEEYRSGVCEQEPDFGPDFAQLPDPLKSVLQRCLTRDPCGRYATATELLSALTAFSADSEPARCVRCGTALPAGSDVCPDCTFNEARPTPPVDWRADRLPPAAKPARRYAWILVPTLAAAAVLAYAGYRIWQSRRPAAIARQAIAESSRPGLSLESRESVLKSAAAKLGGDPHRDLVATKLREAAAAREEWGRILARQQASGGTYEDRILPLQRFVASYRDTAESRRAQEMLKVWQDEQRAFADAQEFERKPDARMCAILARWTSFHTRQKTGFRRSQAWDRMQHWSGLIEDYTGYAELVVRSASGLPPSDSSLDGGGLPDPYFVLLEGTRQSYRSRTFSDNASPIWDEKIRILLRPELELSLEIWDEDPLGRELLLHHPLMPLPCDGPYRVSGGSIQVELEIRREN